MLLLSVDRGLALLLPLLFLFLGLFASLEAAPSPSPSKNRPEELVRVYSINRAQYERVLQLTKGKNVISEARLINGGFATVSDSLSSGWHSLLRIVGLTTLSKADEEAKDTIDFDGQPLCVIKTREDAPRGEGSARSAATDAQDEEESAINCIVVLKKEPDAELPAQDHSQYWYPQSQAAVPPVEEAAVKEQVDEQAEQVEEQPEQAEEQVEVQITTETPLRYRSKSKKQNIVSETTDDSAEEDSNLPRQYGAGYPTPPQYGAYSPYGGYPYSPYSTLQPYPQSYPPYGQSPFPPQQPFGQQPPFGPPSPFGPQSPFGSQPPFGLQQPFGGQSPIGSPYYPQSLYGLPSPNPYTSFPYLEQAQALNAVEKAEAEEEQDEDEDASYEAEDEDLYGYDKKSMIYYKKVSAN